MIEAHANGQPALWRPSSPVSALSWSPYVSSFSLGYQSHLNGATIQARSVSLSPDDTDSSVASTILLDPGTGSGTSQSTYTVSSPNKSAISNAIFYFREPSTNHVRRVEWDSVSGEVMSMRFNFAVSAYANQTVIGYSVQAGNNNGGPNGEGQYVPVSVSRPSSWNQYIQTTYSSGVNGGIITVLRLK